MALVASPHLTAQARQHLKDWLVPDMGGCRKGGSAHRRSRRCCHAGWHDQDDLRITPHHEKGVQEGTGVDLTKKEVAAAA
jgi:hypothetical protein